MIVKLKSSRRIVSSSRQLAPDGGMWCGGAMGLVILYLVHTSRVTPPAPAPPGATQCHDVRSYLNTRYDNYLLSTIKLVRCHST